MIHPHGGRLVSRVVSGEEKERHDDGAIETPHYAILRNDSELARVISIGSVIVDVQSGQR